MRAGVLLLSLLLPSIAVTSCFGLTQGAVDPLIAHLASRLRPPGDAIPDPPTQFRPGPRDITALAASLSQDPDGRSAIAALLDTVFTAYEASAKGSNQENDLAGALAFNIAVNFAAYKGVGPLEPGGTSVMARQIQNALNTHEMRAAANETKQRLYETYIMLAGLLAARIHAAEGDAEALKAVRALGAEGLRHLLNTDPGRVSVTSAGLSIAESGGGGKASTGALKPIHFEARPEWSRKTAADAITLEMRKESFYESGATLVFFSSAQPLSGSIQQASRKYWREQVLADLAGIDEPFVMSTLIAGGLRCGFVQENMRAKSTGVQWSVTLYLVDAGRKAFPILILQSGFLKEQAAAIEQLLKTIRIPGEAPKQKPLATNSQLARNWSMSASSITNYVNSHTGSHAGTSIVAYGASLTLKPDGTYSRSLAGLSNSIRVREREKGRYRLKGDLLILTASSGKVTKRRFLGIDTPARAAGPIMLLLNPEYPLNAMNIGAYGERYGIAGK